MNAEITYTLAALAIGLAAGGGFLGLVALVMSYARAVVRVQVQQDATWQASKADGGRMIGGRDRLGED